MTDNSKTRDYAIATVRGAKGTLLVTSYKGGSAISFQGGGAAITFPRSSPLASVRALRRAAEEMEKQLAAAAHPVAPAASGRRLRVSKEQFERLSRLSKLDQA